MLHLVPLAYTPPTPFATPPLVPPALDPLPSNWATAERLDVVNMTNFSPADCVSIQPGTYADTWCISACAINFCLDDVCACGEGAREEADKIKNKNIDDWGEAEDRERMGCTIVDCPGGLASDVGKQANETSENDADYQNGIDNWKEGEAREKNVDPTKAYPYGLPAVGQQGQEVAKSAEPPRPPFTPVDPATCVSLISSITNEWCVNTCERACPPAQCACDGQGQQGVTITPSPAPVKPVIMPCVSLGTTSSDTNDRWCNLSCVNVNGNCPASMCECDEKKLKEAQDGMLVDRDAAIADRDASIAERNDPADSRH